MKYPNWVHTVNLQIEGAVAMQRGIQAAEREIAQQVQTIKEELAEKGEKASYYYDEEARLMRMGYNPNYMKWMLERADARERGT